MTATVLELDGPTMPTPAVLGTIPPEPSGFGQGRITDAIGGAVVDVLVADASGVLVPVPCENTLASVGIRRGRSSNATAVAEPATVSVQFLDPHGLAAIDFPLRRRIQVQLSQAARAYFGITAATFDAQCVRFAGRITEVTTEDSPEWGSVITVSGSGPLADMGRIYVGDTPWPQQAAIARASQIITLAGFQVSAVGYTIWSLVPLSVTWASVPATVKWSDTANTLNVLARDVDRQPSLDLLSQYAETGALIVTDGVAVDRVDLSQESTRARDLQTAMADPTYSLAWLTLDACELLSDWTASWSLAGMLNRLSIGWGAVPSGGGEQPRTLYTDSTSTGVYGLMEASMSTDLVAQTDADQLASVKLSGHSQVKPVLPSLVTDIWHLAYWHNAYALALGYGMTTSYLWRLTNITPLLPLNALGWAWFEGVSETITDDGWQLELTISDPLSGGSGWIWSMVPVATRWQDMPASVDWADVNKWRG